MLSWAIIEAGVYLIAACLPMMRPIIVAIVPRSIIHRWQTYTGTSAYHPKSASGNRGSKQLLGGRTPKNFSRLHDGPEVRLSPDEGEKNTRSTSAGISRVPTREEIELRHIDGEIQKTVDVTVTQSPAGLRPVASFK